jgi:hypothetical protein
MLTFLQLTILDTPVTPLVEGRVMMRDDHKLLIRLKGDIVIIGQDDPASDIALGVIT